MAKLKFSSRLMLGIVRDSLLADAAKMSTTDQTYGLYGLHSFERQNQMIAALRRVALRSCQILSCGGNTENGKSVLDSTANLNG